MVEEGRGDTLAAMAEEGSERSAVCSGSRRAGRCRFLNAVRDVAAFFILLALRSCVGDREAPPCRAVARRAILLFRDLCLGWFEGYLLASKNAAMPLSPQEAIFGLVEGGRGLGQGGGVMEGCGLVRGFGGGGGWVRGKGWEG